MDLIEVKILIRNLLKRIVVLEDGSKQLPGILTDDEIEALKFFQSILESSNTLAEIIATTSPAAKHIEAEAENIDAANSISFDLDVSILSLSEPQKNVRICLDFGTAMSKATLIKDDEDADFEDIEVLKLGIPGEQQQISEKMLVSSVYIDNDGLIWFGQHAVEKSLLESNDGSRQRLDNIKRRLSEEGLNDKVGPPFNPTNISISYADMVLAYLMFFTWTVNQCTDELGYQRNISRRFAMPCFGKDKERENANKLKEMLGQAQILTDTFANKIHKGIPLKEYVDVLNILNVQEFSYNFVSHGITEPLGVAGSLVSWRQNVNILVMIVDVGAGTSDFSLNRIVIDPISGKNNSVEIENSAVGISEAGNHLDRILIELVLKKAGVNSSNPNSIKIRSELTLSIRHYKESLFLDREVYIALPRYDLEVHIGIEEFLSEQAVKSFGKSLKDTMKVILEKIDTSWIEWVRSHPDRRLVVALTGGGADLPMVKSLAEEDIFVNGVSLRAAPSLHFPNWLVEDYPDLEQDYPRIAVSLGGARKQMIKTSGKATITADLATPPVLGGYYTKG